MIIQIEIIIITMLYHKPTRKMFIQAKVQIADKFMIQNNTTIMNISYMIHQIDMKI
jgi:hypothetical protein